MFVLTFQYYNGISERLKQGARLGSGLAWHPHHNPWLIALSVMDAMRTHPMVIIGGVLQENPFFVPPDQFLLEIRERRAARKNTGAAG